MNQLLFELFELFTRLWNTSNRWLRIAIILIISWFPLLIGAAIIPSHLVINILIFIPILAIVFLVIAFPVLTYLMRIFEWSHNLLKTLATIIAIQISLGIALLLIPISNDRSLVPVFVAAIIAFILFTVGAKKESKTVKRVKKLLVVFISVLVVIFFAGGREKIGQEIEKAKAENEAGLTEEKIQESLTECIPGSQTITFTPGQTQIQVTAEPGCWTPWIAVPQQSTWQWNSAPDSTVDVLYWDGEMRHLTPQSPPTYHGIKEGTFRFRAYEKQEIITVTVQ